MLESSIRTLLIVLALAAATSGCAKPVMLIGQVEWLRDDKFSRADRREILDAARQAGLTDVRKVSKRWHRPSDDHHALVESKLTVTGQRVTWMALIVCSDNDRDHCEGDLGGHPWIRAGDWMTSVGSIGQEERHRVLDGSWHCDVDLGEGVTGQLAELIVTAVRRRTLVNRTRQPDLVVRVETPQLDGIWYYLAIERENSGANMYKFHLVGDGTGRVLILRVVDDQVELVDSSFWDA